MSDFITMSAEHQAGRSAADYDWPSDGLEQRTVVESRSEAFANGYRARRAELLEDPDLADKMVYLRGARMLSEDLVVTEWQHGLTVALPIPLHRAGELRKLGRKHGYDYVSVTPWPTQQMGLTNLAEADAFRAELAEAAAGVTVEGGAAR